MPPSNKVTFDWTIPVPLIAAFVLQLGGLVWWLSSVESRVNQNTQELLARRAAIEQVYRLEGSITGQQQATNTRLVRIERQLDALIEHFTDN